MYSIRVIISCPYGRRARPRCRRVAVRRHGRPPVPAVEPGIFWLTRAGRPGELFRPDFSPDAISLAIGGVLGASEPTEQQDEGSDDTAVGLRGLIV